MTTRTEAENERLSFYEFFAGGGMARLGLGRRWRCLMANDICEKKAASYRRNFPPGLEYICKDVADLSVDELPGSPVLVWASFPCQDLSLAGQGLGLEGKRSGTFWPFWELMKGMVEDSRAAEIVVLENVTGAITSHEGRDFQAIFTALADAGYKVGPLVIDGVYFVPQSRPRLFMVAVRGEREFDLALTRQGPDPVWHPRSLRSAYAGLQQRLREAWLWWRLPLPDGRTKRLSDLIQEEPGCGAWHTKAETQRLLSLMSDRNLAKVGEARRRGRPVIGMIYKRTRKTQDGERKQRAEVRFDQISGCLRTPAGGSSRQVVMVVHGESVRTRLLTAREAARLMGVPDSYVLPDNYNEAYQLMGDGLVIPVVSWLEKWILRGLALPRVPALEHA